MHRVPQNVASLVAIALDSNPVVLAAGAQAAAAWSNGSQAGDLETEGEDNTCCRPELFEQAL